MKRHMLFGGAACVIFAAIVGYLNLYKTPAQASRQALGAGGLPVAVEVTAETLSLTLANKAAVRFAGGWALKAANPDFGGFSGLVIDSETGNLIAINDKGDWWQAAFDPRKSTPPATGTLRGYTPDGDVSKVELDAESLIRFRDGYLVSFEQRHRLEFVAEPGEEPTPPPGLPSVNFAGVAGNGGLEAIALLPSGAVLAFTERGLDTSGRLTAWLLYENTTADIRFKPPVNFAPTDAATLPNGDVLLLLRKYSPLDGVAIKVMHIRADDIRPGATLEGIEILHLTPEGPVDNMEGLDVVALDDNAVRMVMISDDNFNLLQRTLLMMFDYKYR